MSWRDILLRSARSLRQAKVRTMLTALALAVGGFTLTATLAAANGARAYGAKLVDTNFDPSSLVVTKSTRASQPYFLSCRANQLALRPLQFSVVAALPVPG